MTEIIKDDTSEDVLFNHLMVKYFFKYNPNQMGVLIESDLPEWPGKYVLFHDGERCIIMEFDAGIAAEEFSTVSYGPLN